MRSKPGTTHRAVDAVDASTRSAFAGRGSSRAARAGANAATGERQRRTERTSGSDRREAARQLSTLALLEVSQLLELTPHQHERDKQTDRADADENHRGDLHLRLRA